MLHPQIVRTPFLQVTKLTPNDGDGYSNFGAAVAMGNNTAIVGDCVKEAIYVFTPSNGTWSQQAKLAPAAPGGTYFSSALAMSNDTIVCGAPEEHSRLDASDLFGAAYIYTGNGENWNQQARMTTSEAGYDDAFGCAVAASGDTALVGSVYRSQAAYVFNRSGATWCQQAKLTPPGSVSYDMGFGCTLALSGDTALVGAWGEAYVFTRSNTTWSLQAKLTPDDSSANDYFGRSVALDGDTALIGAWGKNNYTGAAYVFTRSNAAWSQQAKLTPDDLAANDEFGFAVALQGDRALVGAYRQGNGTGAAYVFGRSGVSWTQQRKLMAFDAASGDGFGFSVALNGGVVLVGAMGKTAAYLFINALF
jgi:hypothetical protein